jgi:hypothetical protein
VDILSIDEALCCTPQIEQVLAEIHQARDSAGLLTFRAGNGTAAQAVDTLKTYCPQMLSRLREQEKRYGNRWFVALEGVDLRQRDA